MDTLRESAARIPLMLEVEYKKSYARIGEKGQLKNISVSGAFIEHENQKLGATDKVTLMLRVGGRERSVSASVIWSNSRGAGIKFLPTNNRDIQIVDDLMYYVESKRETRRNIVRSIFKHVA